MQVAFILMFFTLIILLGFCLGLRKRSKKENVFYLFSILISLTTLLWKSVEF